MRSNTFTSILLTCCLTAGISFSALSERPSYSELYLTSGKMTQGILLASDITDSDEEANVGDPDEEHVIRTSHVGDPDEEANVGDPDEEANAGDRMKVTFTDAEQLLAAARLPQRCKSRGFRVMEVSKKCHFW